MSKKEEKTNVMRVLEQKGIPFTPHTYPHEDGVAVDGVTVARSMGQDPECVFNTLVARGTGGAEPSQLYTTVERLSWMVVTVLLALLYWMALTRIC